MVRGGGGGLFQINTGRRGRDLCEVRPTRVSKEVSCCAIPDLVYEPRKTVSDCAREPGCWQSPPHPQAQRLYRSPRQCGTGRPVPRSKSPAPGWECLVLESSLGGRFGVCPCGSRRWRPGRPCATSRSTEVLPCRCRAAKSCREVAVCVAMPAIPAKTEQPSTSGVEGIQALGMFLWLVKFPGQPWARSGERQVR